MEVEKVAARTFETNFKELKNIVENMEKNPSNLKDLLKNFEKASTLYSKCVDELKSAEQKVMIIREEHFGVTEAPFDSEDEDDI